MFCLNFLKITPDNSYQTSTRALQFLYFLFLLVCIYLYFACFHHNIIHLCTFMKFCNYYYCCQTVPVAIMAFMIYMFVKRSSTVAVPESRSRSRTRELFFPFSWAAECASSAALTTTFRSIVRRGVEKSPGSRREKKPPRQSNRPVYGVWAIWVFYRRN